jgi:hypothetical protein
VTRPPLRVAARRVRRAGLPVYPRAAVNIDESLLLGNDSISATNDKNGNMGFAIAAFLVALIAGAVEFRRFVNVACV